MTPSRRDRARLWAARMVLAAGATLLAQAAFAQSCSRTGATTSTCRFLLSQPRSLTLVARAQGHAGHPAAATLSVQVDGVGCLQTRAGGARRRIDTGGACPLRLAAGEHTIEAVLTLAPSPPRGATEASEATDAALSVSLDPPARLAPLPREAAALGVPLIGPFHLLPLHF